MTDRMFIGSTYLSATHPPETYWFTANPTDPPLIYKINRHLAILATNFWPIRPGRSDLITHTTSTPEYHFPPFENLVFDCVASGPEDSMSFYHLQTGISPLLSPRELTSTDTNYVPNLLVLPPKLTSPTCKVPYDPTTTLTLHIFEVKNIANQLLLPPETLERNPYPNHILHAFSPGSPIRQEIFRYIEKTHGQTPGPLRYVVAEQMRIELMTCLTLAFLDWLGEGIMEDQKPAVRRRFRTVMALREREGARRVWMEWERWVHRFVGVCWWVCGVDEERGGVGL